MVHRKNAIFFYNQSWLFCSSSILLNYKNKKNATFQKSCEKLKNLKNPQKTKQKYEKCKKKYKVKYLQTIFYKYIITDMKPIKIVVFDLDETLGYFTELGIFWDSLNAYIKTKNINYELDQSIFNKVLDLFKEFIRPNILSILSYLKYKKQTRACHSVLIYTNNQGPKEWASYIKHYFETKIKFPLFDKIIGAFKVNGKKYELCRTSHEKTINDLLKCSKLPANTEICFLDDVLYPEMSGKNIYYIKVNPYIHDIAFDQMIQRFSNSNILEKLDSDGDFENFMINYMEQYDYKYIEKPKEEYEIDEIITKKTMFHLQTFFNKNWNDQQHSKSLTNKKKQSIRNKTSKKTKRFS